MDKNIPHKKEPIKHDISLLGGNAIIYGILGFLPLLAFWNKIKYIGTINNTALEILAYLYILFPFGLLFIGILILLRSRFLLLILLPLSVIGLITFPYGTIYYIFFLREFWLFHKLYYPFNRKERDVFTK